MIAGPEMKARHEQRDAGSKIQSVSGLFKSRLAEDAKRTAAVYGAGGPWNSLTWGELDSRGEELAWGLLSLGVGLREMVSLIGATRLEWTICDLSVMFAGAVAVPVYHSNTAEEIQ